MTSRSMPTCVKVFGTLHIIFGTIGVLYSFVLFSIPPLNTQALKLADINVPLLNYLQLSSWCYVLGSLTTLFLGASLLTRRAWARFSTVIFAYVQLAWLALSTVLSIVVLKSIYSNLPRYIGDISSNPQIATNADNVGVWIGSISSVMGSLMIAIYPILTLIFLSKANVKAAFNELPRA